MLAGSLLPTVKGLNSWAWEWLVTGVAVVAVLDWAFLMQLPNSLDGLNQF